MARKQRQKQNTIISDEMEARINSASESELQTIMAEAGHQYESAKEHMETDPDICSAKLKVKELTATDREDMKAARAISKRAHAEQISFFGGSGHDSGDALSRGHRVEIKAKVAKGPLFPDGSKYDE